jgi:hypothetical protein
LPNPSWIVTVTVYGDPDTDEYLCVVLPVLVVAVEPSPKFQAYESVVVEHVSVALAVKVSVSAVVAGDFEVESVAPESVGAVTVTAPSVGDELFPDVSLIVRVG